MAGRVAATLLVLAGLVTMASVGLPEPAGFNRGGVLVVGGLGATFGAVVLSLPWRRWPARASLTLAVPALTLVAFHNWYGGRDAYRYSIFFVVIFVWAGTFHPRGTSVTLAVPTAVAYLIPLFAAGAPASALASAGYAIPMFVAVGEILAWRGARVSQLERELRDAALHDPLTGLANRRLALDRLEECVARSRRAGDYVHVLYVDIDQFKGVNDTYGHDGGDLILLRVAQTLTRVVRPSDTAARLAGDEFLVVIESEDPDAGRLAAERILASLEDGTTVSIGLASRRGADMPAEVLLRAADTALYEAKRTGRNRCCVSSGVLVPV